jgi:hypothetical protein
MNDSKVTKALRQAPLSAIKQDRSRSRGLSKSASEKRLPSNERLKTLDSPSKTGKIRIQTKNTGLSKKETNYQIFSSERSLVLQQQITPSSSSSDQSFATRRTNFNDII